MRAGSLRVGVTGAQGVGKSTLARQLFERCEAIYPGTCDHLPSLGAEVAQRGFPLGSSVTAESLAAFAAAHVRRERGSYKPITILDRNLLDLTAYARVSMAASEALLELLYELCCSYSTRYQLIVFVPMIPELAENPARHESAEFRQKIDREIPALAKVLGVELRTVRGGEGERCEQAFEWVKAAL